MASKQKFGKKKLVLATALVLQQWAMAPVMAQQATTQLAANRVLDEVTVTSTRGIGSDINRAAATVSVITAEELEEQNARDINDALRYEPGVEVRRSVYRVGGVTGAAATTGRGGNEGINIRGLDGNRVMLLEDGVALPRSYSQGTLFAGRGAYTDTDLYQRIEILRGPASSMYGSDGLTGVVNFVTKDPQDFLNVFGKSSYFALRPSYDSTDRSFGSTATMAFGGDTVQGMLVLNARHGHETDTKGTVGGTGSNRTEADPLTYNNRSALGKLVFKIDARNVLKLSLERVENKLSGNSLSAIAAPTITGYQSTSDVTSDKLQLLFEHDDENNAMFQKMRANLYYRDAKTHQYSFENGAAPTRPRYRDINYKDNIVGGGVLAESGFNTGSVKHKLTYGFDASVATQQMAADGTGWTTCTGTQYCEYFPKTEYSVLGSYVQDDMRLGALSIIPGLRYDAYKLDPKASAKYDAQAIANNQPATSKSDNALSPRLAFIYEVSPALLPYVQYARGFRSPSPQEVNSYFNNAAQGYSQIANPNLKSETSNSYEIGLRGKLPAAAGMFSYSTAAYYGKYRDFIDSTVVHAGALTALDPRIYQYTNVAKATIKGVEGRLDWRLENGVTLKTGFAYTKGRSTDQTTGIETGLDSVAPLSIITGVRYEPSNVWFAQTNMIYNAGKNRSDIATQTNFVTPSFFVMDLNAGYRFSKNVVLYAGIRNLFDRKYWNWNDIRGLSLAETATNKDAYTEPGRSFNVSMKFEY